MSLFVYLLKTTRQLHWKLLTSGICVFSSHMFHGGYARPGCAESGQEPFDYFHLYKRYQHRKKTH